MKAIICTNYGKPDVLQIQELAKPKPKANEILIKIHASSITTADSMMRSGTPFYGRLFIGLMKPKFPITGTGFSGEIESIGSAVSLFKVGDLVFGESILGDGTNAEYVCVAESGIVAVKPGNLSHEEAAPLCDGAMTSLNFLKTIAAIKSGQKVLINGASGSLGTAAIQLAKYFGAEVTAVCSAKNDDLVKSLGADFVIDYEQVTFTELAKQYDIIYDTLGNLSYSRCKKVLLPEGDYLSPVLSMALLLQMLCSSLFGKKKAKFSATGLLSVQQLRLLLDDLLQIIGEGKLTSVVSRSYCMDDIVEAHSYIDMGHKQANIVLVIKASSTNV